ncbi:MAG: DUF5107 domain-containing protein [Saprospiraceae bacterium]|nr:DUF5107 domain-containing protein [Saprospiraceae bacterium]
MIKTSLATLFLLIVSLVFGQEATIIESKKVLPTYPFSDPNPVTVLTSNPKIYPYHTYEGYGLEPEDQEWTVVTLENEYISVYVLPEVGGKVWGAIDRKSGKEFIYRNEVMKFRNISMRGPWTSGGIEFNFGIIGHHPSTATPVDYRTQKNEDGSVSCIVGNIDLPSRTQWRVEIRLPADRAYFETRVLFNNPDPLPQAYYNWMTAAAFAQEDLVFYCPGDQYVEHGGNSHPWPTHESNGRDLSHYRENNFGGSKSYHVVGEYDDFFGGYFENEGYGFGHWAPYEEMPGQKLWLWALSRQGGIWEDLLTDSDGQYIEFQAGRMFDQYSLGADQNPITKSSFEPGRSDIWREFWFPVPKMGGITEVSKGGILHVMEEDGQRKTLVSSFAETVSPIIVITQSGDTLHHQMHQLVPLSPISVAMGPSNSEQARVEVPGLQLRYDPMSAKLLDRPFEMDEDLQLALSASEDRTFRNAEQHLWDRNYEQAKKMFVEVLQKDPVHLESMLGLAHIYFRNMQLDSAYWHVDRALQLDAYHAKANYLAGIIHKALGHDTDALETFGWAARSLAFRAESYFQIASLKLSDGDVQDARKYANNALDFNRFHLGARQILVVLQAMEGAKASAARNISAIRTLDPLSHFGLYETYKLTENPADLQSFQNGHRSEFPYQTYLELAIGYHNMGVDDRAVEVLELAPEHPMVDVWHAWLINDERPVEAKVLLERASAASADFVFPYRMESVAPLQWALDQSDSWKFKYYRALQLWGFHQRARALEFMHHLRDEPHLASFYLTRAALQSEDQLRLEDLRRAAQLDPDSWRARHALLSHLPQDAAKTLSAAEEAYQQFAGNDAIAFRYIEILLQQNHPAEAIRVMKNAHVLPFEGASKGRQLWESAHLMNGVQLAESQRWDEVLEQIRSGRSWPENLGVGRPYEVDERKLDFLEMLVALKQGSQEDATGLARTMVDHTMQSGSKRMAEGLLALYASYLAKDEQSGQSILKQLDLDTSWDDVLRQFKGAFYAISSDDLLVTMLDQDEDQIAVADMLKLAAQ